MSTLDKLKRVEELKEELDHLEQEIENEQAQCKHSFEKCSYVPIQRQVGDYFGYRMQTSVEPEWERECKKCGYVEVTNKSTVAATWS